MPLDSLARHRSVVGKYNAIAKNPTEKAIIKAFKKAQNSVESPRSQRAHSKTSKNTSSPLATIVKVALVASVVAATIPSTGAITNGISRESNWNAKTTFPLVHIYTNTWRSNFRSCSSTRISPNKVLTAGHCWPAGSVVMTVPSSADSFTETKTYTSKGTEADLAIFTFPQNLAGNTFCIPVMSKSTYQMLKESPPNICGLKGRFIILGYGESGSTYSARSAVFEPIELTSDVKRSLSKRTTGVRGVPVNDMEVISKNGDSGSGVLGCNPATGQYELVGVLVQSINVRLSGESFNLGSAVTNLVEYPELSTWVASNRGSCTRSNINPNDIYDTKVRNNRETHRLDKCKLPIKYYPQARMSNKEICDCYQRRRLEAPEEFNCNAPPYICVNYNIEESQKLGVKGDTYLTVYNRCKEDVVINYGLVNNKARFISTLPAGDKFTQIIPPQFNINRNGVIFSKGNQTNVPAPDFFDLPNDLSNRWLYS